jgi:hypothetical protein
VGLSAFAFAPLKVSPLGGQAGPAVLFQSLSGARLRSAAWPACMVAGERRGTGGRASAGGRLQEPDFFAGRPHWLPGCTGGGALIGRDTWWRIAGSIDSLHRGPFTGPGWAAVGPRRPCWRSLSNNFV